MKTNIVIGVIFLMFSSSCIKHKILKSECIDRALDEFSMVEYTGQKLECNSFLWLFRYDDEQYLVFDNPCVDMIHIPIDCNGFKLCTIDEYAECTKFFKNANRIRIVGVRE